MTLIPTSYVRHFESSNPTGLKPSLTGLTVLPHWFSDKSLFFLYISTAVMKPENVSHEGNPKTRKPETRIRNRKPESGIGIGTGNQKPESGIRTPESTKQQNKFFKFTKIV